MARRLAYLGSRSISKHRLLRTDVESLEDRMAPGSMLDVFWVAAIDFAPNRVNPLEADVVVTSTDGMTRSPSAFNPPFAVDLPEPSTVRIAVGPDSHTDLVPREPPASLNDRFDPAATDATMVGGNLDSILLGLEDKAFRPESIFGTSERLPRNEDRLSQSHGILNWDQSISSGLTLAGVAGPIETAYLEVVSVPALARGATNLAVSAVDQNVELPRADQVDVVSTEMSNNSTAATEVVGEMGAEESRVPRGLPYATGTEVVQSMHPYAITYDGTSKAPMTGVVKSPAEYDPMRGVLFSYTSYSSIVTDMVKELTEDPTKDDIAYVVVSSAAQQNSATTSFMNAGADLSKVQFFIQPSNSVWIRDYGPHFIMVDDSLAIVDSHYYPNRPSDNFIPTLLGDNNFNVPTYDMGLYYSGGNFQPGPNNSGFVTSLVNYHNTTTDGFNANFISELYHDYQGIDTLHVLPQLPFSVDATGHIDMWMYLVDHDTVVISEFNPGANSTAIQIANNAVTYMQGLGFDVYRTPAWNVGSTHYTYANAFRVNDRIFVPVYGTALKPGGNSNYNDEDAAAMAAWQAAAGPGVEIIPIQSSQIISAAGAIHCIVKQVPRYTGSVPAVNVVSPTGGEVLLLGSQHKIEWSAIDTNNIDPVEISIFVSQGAGSYRHITTTTDTGSYWWTVDGRIARSATIKLVAKSADNDQVEAFSHPFTIANGTATTYDFASGAGVNKFAYGSQTASWANINGNPWPVDTQLSPANYAAMSTSNAAGGDSDTNRYIAPVPSPIGNESTHTFLFTLAEPIQSIAQIDVLWEGYADFCTQVELYVWDMVAQNWGDAAGLTGNNRYMDSWAGNADGYLNGSIRSDFSRYVDGTGAIRFLVYADRTGTNPDTQHNAGQGLETFHDYMSVTVKQVEPRIATDVYYV